MKRQYGVALISVLLIVALASILATKMTGKLIMQMQRTVNVTSNQQAYWYALGAEAFATSVLSKTFQNEPDVTHLGQFWAQGETSYPVEQGQITGQIFDLQACFNLNALRASDKNADGRLNINSSRENQGADNNPPSPSSDKDDNGKPIARQSFERLLRALNIEGVDEFTAEYLADALSDWLDKDSMIASAGGAEDSDYSSREFPYLTANHYMASVNELRMVEHFTPEIINVLKDYVCVIPNSNLHKININTLAEEQTVLLEALLDVNSTDASDIMSSREENGFTNIDDFFALSNVQNKNLTEKHKQQFAVDSEYFKLKTMASFNNSYVNLNSIIWISNNKHIQVIARSIGRE